MSVGRVSTERVLLYDEGDPLVLSSGARLAPVEVAYETYGSLNDARDNAVFICHALTGDAHAAGHHGDPSRPGWWDSLIGPGRAIDTEKYFVVSPNLLGGCQGTTGPSSTDPATGKPYGMDFPLLSMSDLVTVHRRLLAHLGIDRLHAAVGGSLGGMQILQWTIDAPEQVGRAVLIAASALLSAQNIAFSAVARTAIMRDPDFREGKYAEAGVRPEVGLSVARMLAHITYVSEQLLDTKFGRERRGDGPPRMGTDFQVESYLDHQASTFLDRFDALSYLYLTRVMDYFEPFADPTAAERAAAYARFLLISFDTDWRFPTHHSVHLHEQLVAAGADSAHVEITSAWGHDSFLLQPPGYHALVAEFLA